MKNRSLCKISFVKERKAKHNPNFGTSIDITIYNVYGQLVLRESINGKVITLNVSSLLLGS